MAVDGVLANHQPLGDLAVREPLGDEAKHLPLARRQLAKRGTGVAGADRRQQPRARSASASARARAGVQGSGASRSAASVRPSATRVVASSIRARAASNGPPLRSKRSIASSSSGRARSCSPPAAASSPSASSTRPAEARCRPAVRSRAGSRAPSAASSSSPRARAREPAARAQGRGRARGLRAAAAGSARRARPRGRLAAVERQASAAELRRRPAPAWSSRCAASSEPALPPPQLRQPDQRSPDHRRARAREVLDRGLQHRLRVRPPAPPEVDRAVLGAAEGEHVAAPVALRELGDPVAPLERPLVVAHGGAGGDQEAARPGAGDRDLGLALEGRRGGLVEAAHALLDLRARRPARRPRARGRASPGRATANRRPSSAARRAELRRLRGLAARVRDVALEEGKPAVLGAGLERVEQAMRASQPAARHRQGAVEVELIAREPRGHAGSAGDVPALPCRGGRHARALRTPPRRRRATTPPSSAPRTPRASLGGHRLLEARPRLLPTAPPGSSRQPISSRRGAGCPDAWATGPFSHGATCTERALR